MVVLRNALNKAVKIQLVEAYTSAGTSAIDSAAVDMQGYEGVLFLTTIAVANSGNYVKVQTGTTSTPTDDLEGTKVICTVAGGPIWVDVFRPQERYLRLYVTRGSSTACGEIYAIKYGGTDLPEDNDVALTIQGEEHISPAEGTA